MYSFLKDLESSFALETPVGAAPAGPLPPAKSESVFVLSPLPVWPLKARWLETVSLVELQGRYLAPGEQEGGREQAGHPPLPPPRHPPSPLASVGLVRRLPRVVCLKPCPVLLSDAHVYCSLNRVWRKN